MKSYSCSTDGDFIYLFKTITVKKNKRETDSGAALLSYFILFVSLSFLLHVHVPFNRFLYISLRVEKLSYEVWQLKEKFFPNFSHSYAKTVFCFFL